MFAGVANNARSPLTFDRPVSYNLQAFGIPQYNALKDIRVPTVPRPFNLSSTTARRQQKYEQVAEEAQEKQMKVSSPATTSCQSRATYVLAACEH